MTTSDAPTAPAAADLPTFDPEAGTLLASPPAGVPGSWVGAPSVFADEASAELVLTYRRRNPRDGSEQERGFELVIATTTTGTADDLAEVWRVTKQQLGTRSIERGAIARSPEGTWLLYLSYEHPDLDDRWVIDVLEAPTLDAFDVTTRTRVLDGDLAGGVDATKDPWVTRRADGTYLMLVSTFTTAAGPAPTSWATSVDGRSFEWHGTTLDVGAPGSWDAYQARLNSALPWGDGWLGFYDGAASAAEDTEERCGLAWSTDGIAWRSVTPEGPVLVSAHGRGSLRYVDGVRRDGALWLAYEHTRPDGAHELRAITVADPFAGR